MTGNKPPEGERERGLTFSFITPPGWHILDSESGTNGQIQEFHLNPSPITYFPHSQSLLLGRGYENATPERLQQAIQEFKRSPGSVQKLDWKTGEFPGECFTFESDDEFVGYEPIKCFVLIPQDSERSQTDFFSSSRLFIFDYNGMSAPENPMRKQDEKHRTELKEFFASLQRKGGGER